MRRLFIFSIILGACAYMISCSCREMGVNLHMPSFTAGLVAAAFTGAIWFIAGHWFADVHKYFEPQKVLTPTKDTPYHVGCNAVIAVLWMVIILSVLGYVVYSLLATGVIP